jgi:hypothetical protein
MLAKVPTSVEELAQCKKKKGCRCFGWLPRVFFFGCFLLLDIEFTLHGWVVCVDAAREAAAVFTARRLPRRRVLYSWVPGAHARPARKAGGGGA